MKPFLALLAAVAACALLFLALRGDATGDPVDTASRVRAQGPADSGVEPRDVGPIEDDVELPGRTPSATRIAPDAAAPSVAGDTDREAKDDGPFVVGRVTDASDRAIGGAEVSLSHFGLGFDSAAAGCGGQGNHLRRPRALRAGSFRGDPARPDRGGGRRVRAPRAGGGLDESLR